MRDDPHDDLFPLENDTLDELFQQKPLGGDAFVRRTLHAVRDDLGRRRRRRTRRLLTSASALAACLVLAFALFPTPSATEIQLAEIPPPSEADALLYGEMLALESLLAPADALTVEENRQTLDLLLFLAEN